LEKGRELSMIGAKKNPSGNFKSETMLVEQLGGERNQSGEYLTDRSLQRREGGTLIKGIANHSTQRGGEGDLGGKKKASSI